jgi:hypothetical protein
MSAKTYYFETYTCVETLYALLKKYCKDEGLSYFKYITYRVPDVELKYKCLKMVKIVGVLQFEKRFSPTILRRLFERDHVSMALLTSAQKPLVLIYMKMHVLAQYHNISWETAACSDTPFGFGGEKTMNEKRVMHPYIEALLFYEQCAKPDFLKYLQGAKEICAFKFRLEKSEDYHI